MVILQRVRGLKGWLRKGWVKATAIMIAVALLAGYYAMGPESGAYPRCMFLQLTGWQCPGCGSQRAFHALLHGQLSQAWHYNAILFFEIPLVILLLAVSRYRHRFAKLHNFLNSRTIILTILVTIIGWTVLRNLAYGS